MITTHPHQLTHIIPIPCSDYYTPAPADPPEHIIPIPCSDYYIPAPADPPEHIIPIPCSDYYTPAPADPPEHIIPIPCSDYYTHAPAEIEITFDHLKQTKFRPSTSAPINSAKRLDFTTENGGIDTRTQYISVLLPTLITKLKSAGLWHEFQRSLLEQIVDGKFPLDNLSLLLFLETAKWYSLEDKKTMNYRDTTVQVWKIGYRICHGTFLRLMSGSGGDGIVNFPVPTVQTLLDYQPFKDLPVTLQPGIIKSAIRLTKKDPRYQVVSFDGKKLAAGLSKDEGDEDLFGHETDETLTERKDRLQTNMDVVLAAQVQSSEAEDVTKAVILEIVRQMSIDISYVRKIKVKQEKRLRLCMDKAGPNWRESRFVFAISALQTAVYQEDAYLKRALDNIHCLVLITQQKQSEKGQLWWALKPEEAMPDEYANQLEYTHQRTDKWFEARKSRPLTGRTLYSGCGMGKFKDLVRHYGTKILDVADTEEVSEDTAKFMRHGTINEENARATLVGIVMPLYYPDYSYYEEGAPLIEGSDGEPLMLVSPANALWSAITII